MIEKLDPHDRARLRNAFGKPVILIGWCRIAGGVVVDQDDARCRLADGRREDLARMGQGRRQRADGHNFLVDELVAGVQEEGEQVLPNPHVRIVAPAYNLPGRRFLRELLGSDR